MSGNEKDAFTKSLPIIEVVKKTIPTFHTRAMRSVLFTKFLALFRLAMLCYLYSELTGDSSAAGR